MSKNYLKASYWLGVMDREDRDPGAWLRTVVDRVMRELDEPDDSEDQERLHLDANGWVE